jgi:protocatechuate 3,4-dioxygenase beta subunit
MADDARGASLLTLSGRVTDRACKGLSGLRVEFWHAGPDGAYDQTGFRFRTHLITSSDGSYRLRTATPGLYPGRTRHIHVSLLDGSRTLLTTQVYWPQEPGNRKDSLFDPSLVMAISGPAADQSGRFDFVLDT